MCKEKSSYQRYAAAAMILTGIMLFGLLSHSVVFFFLNRFYPSPAAVSVYTEAGREAAMAMRLTWRSRAEAAQGACIWIYTIGGLILLRLFIRSKAAAGLRTVLLFFAGTAAGMALCFLPFALADRNSFYDYLFPFRGAVVVVGAFFLAMVIVEILGLKKNSAD